MVSDDDLDDVEAPWGYVCEYLFDMAPHLDALYRPDILQEYLSMTPATFDDWWTSHHYYNNTHPDFWVSEGREEGW